MKEKMMANEEQNEGQTVDREKISLLLIEDNARYLEQLQKWLGRFGYTQVDVAKSAAEAEEKLCDPYDVIVADMRMETDKSGFDVLYKVRDLNISSVVIILTANDTVADCRRAFLEKAWDYIPKNLPGVNVFEELDRSIQRAFAYIERWGNMRDEEWIEGNWAKLEQEYDGQYIAVVNGRVIEHAVTEEALNQAIEELELRRFLVTVRLVGEVPNVAELVAQGEGHHLEFKSCLRAEGTTTEEKGRLQDSILKTIVAFINSKGGTLLIGVEDDREGRTISGIEPDLRTFQRNSTDEFELHLMNLVRDRIGSAFIDRVRLVFEEVEGRMVCIVQVKMSKKPAFARRIRDNQKIFFIRNGSQSTPLDSQEMYEYCSARSVDS
jgi:DNA-binding response OmpR family regulator